MHANHIVARLLGGVQSLMHASRWRALHDVSNAAVSGASLSLTSLALRTNRTTMLLHRVKCVDRLLGSIHLSIERQAIYAALARQWLSGLPQLLIVVDWSSLTADMRWHWLRWCWNCFCWGCTGGASRRCFIRIRRRRLRNFKSRKASEQNLWGIYCGFSNGSVVKR